MQTFTLTIDCDCGGEMETVVGNMSASADDPIRINVDLAISQTTFTCPDCGDQCHTSDLADICYGDVDV